MTEDKTADTLPAVDTGEPPEEPPPKASPYDGKTPEELKAILEEKERMIGKQAQEVGDLRAKSSDLENKLHFKEQFGNPTEPNPTNVQIGDENLKTETQSEVPADYWTNPRKYHAQWAAEDKKKEFEELQKRDSEIRTNVYKAKPVIEQARKETPHVFDGVSPKEMDEGVYTWLANKWIHPHQLGDPVAHRRIATWIQGEKTEYTYAPKAPSGDPVPPTETETYVGNKPPADAANKTPIPLNALSKEFLKNRPKNADGTYKDTEEEFLDKVRETQRRK